MQQVGVFLFKIFPQDSPIFRLFILAAYPSQIEKCLILGSIGIVLAFILLADTIIPSVEVLNVLSAWAVLTKCHI
jgi:hypothetical protein